MSLRVAIIGAGISGLVSIKQCLEEGIEPVCFEALGHFGGQWHYTDPDPETGKVVSSIYRSLIINTSRETMMMSDFPMDPKVYAMYTHNSKVKKYFESYAEFFKIQPYIRLNHRVRRALPEGDGKWTVEVESNGEVTVDTYDAVFVCTGHHSTPNVPDWEDADKFEGELIHSHYYRNTVKFREKDVAVVGIGNSGADISAELSTCTKSTHLITRSGSWIWPRFLFGQPFENVGSRFMLNFMPRPISIAVTQQVLNFTLGTIPQELKPEHNLLAAHPTIRSDLFERIRTGTITPHRGSIKRFTKKGIELTNGEIVEPLDAVVAATGYTLNFPFLPKGIVQSDEDEDGKENWANLYRLIMAPGHPGLYFIGLCQPLGALMPVSEMQARWVTAVMKGEIPLPSPEKMHEDIAAYQNNLRKVFVKSPRHTLEVEFFPYMDMLARDLGAQVTAARFLSTFGLWQGLKTAWSAYFGPPSAVQYRFFGKGKKEELARLVVQRLARKDDEGMSDEEVAEVERYRPSN
ncbi:N-oxide-forming dimethylaniline monooxygenase [Choiromyces venosus 120613-1]|uniref:Flavin-containing monooxygenase 1 n=1 Tax=Choiromyces venosus 120613-1 TaxID=1336337 RepID=A0A3N4JU67_9PEZI|nr:N-oxide-forming dimethylaniline monooxygenase [Choiromyces venosus 120613-1]